MLFCGFARKACPKELGAQATTKKVERCAQEKLDQFQQRSRSDSRSPQRARLALARATGIRIHGIGFKSNAVLSRLFERPDRTLGTQESGGTFRQASTATQLLEHITSAGTEIAGQAIVELDSQMQMEYNGMGHRDDGRSRKKHVPVSPLPYTRPR